MLRYVAVVYICATLMINCFKCSILLFIYCLMQVLLLAGLKSYFFTFFAKNIYIFKFLYISNVILFFLLLLISGGVRFDLLSLFGLLMFSHSAALNKTKD